MQPILIDLDQQRLSRGVSKTFSLTTMFFKPTDLPTLYGSKEQVGDYKDTDIVQYVQYIVSNNLDYKSRAVFEFYRTPMALGNEPLQVLFTFYTAMPSTKEVLTKSVAVTIYPSFEGQDNPDDLIPLINKALSGVTKLSAR